MCIKIKNPVLITLLTTLLGLILVGQLAAQTFNTLYNFNGNGDGDEPLGDLLLLGNTLYGTTYFGGASWGSGGTGEGYGTVFAVNTDGTGATILYSFTDGGDGGHPRAGVVLAGGKLIGAANDGGAGGLEYISPGTLFSLNPDGTGIATLYSFTPLLNGTSNADGALPVQRLSAVGSYLYGATTRGGDFGLGTLFRINVGW